MKTHRIRRISTALCLVQAAIAATACSDLTTEVHRVPQDHPTIQSAIDAADGADVISISPGVYQERLFIDYKPYLTLRGKGDVVIDAGGGFNAVAATGAISLHIRGVRITNAHQAGLRLDSCPDAVVDGCTIDDVRRFGVHVLESSAVRIEHTLVRDTDIAGIYLDDTRPPSEVVIDECEIRDAGRHGVFLHGDRHTVRRTKISDVTNNGIVCRSNDAVIEGVHVARSEGEGILSTAPGTTLRRCRVERVAYSGFTTTAADAVLDRCTVEDAGKVAFSAQGDRATLTRCRATRTGLAAVQVLGDDTILRRCSIRSAGVLESTGTDTAGVHARGARIDVAQCQVMDAAGTGIRVDASGAVLRANRVLRAGGLGVVLTVGGNRLTKNRVKRCVGGALRDDAPGENVLERNRLGERR